MEGDMYRINHANIKDWAANYEGELFNGILCDPPYELGFMGKSWDSSGIAFDVDMWADVYKLLKPGGHLLAFSGSRTYHRMAVAIEDAGFEIRDQIMYVYGSGFPKSLNVYKQLMKQCECGNMEVYENRVQQAGQSREQEAEHYLRFVQQASLSPTKPTREESGEVLQPSVSEQGTHDEGQEAVAVLQVPKGRGEPSLEGRDNPQTTKGQLQGSDIPEVSREVSADGEKRRLHNATQAGDGSTPGENTDKNGSGTSHRPQSEQQQYREPCAFCKQWGTQATRTLGIGTALKPAHEPCVLARKPLDGTVANNVLKHGTGGLNIDGTRIGFGNESDSRVGTVDKQTGAMGKGAFGIKTGKDVSISTYKDGGRFPANLIHDGSDEVEAVFPNNNSRFFYCSKASKSERNAGLEGFEDRIAGGMQGRADGSLAGPIVYNKNVHPTVKPLSLTKYLATLIKPPTGGRLLVPFSGSGSEMIGALQAGWEYVEGVELTEEYIPIAEARIAYWLEQMKENDRQMEIL